MAVEVAYPADENAIVALQQVCGILFSALLVPVLEVAAEGKLSLPGGITGDYALLEFIAASALLYFITFDAPLKRTQMDKLQEVDADAALKG